MSLGRKWQTATRSGSQGQCVEARDESFGGSRVVGIRDSKDTGGTALSVSGASWTAFIAAIGDNVF